MLAWLWIAPVVTLAHAATAGDGTRRARLPWWWDWPLGALVAGIAAAAALEGAQLDDAGPAWVWHVLPAMSTVAYISRAPLGIIEALLPATSEKTARMAAGALVVGAAVVSIAVTATATSHIFRGVLAGVVPPIHVGAVHMRDYYRSVLPKRRNSPVVPLPTAVHTPPPQPDDPGIVGNVMRPVLQPWNTLSVRSNGGTTVY